MEINGKRVVDAKKPATIHITPTDAKMGDNKNPSGCAAARAAKHSIVGCLSARVHVGRVYIEHKDKWVKYKTPAALRQEMITFDRGGGFQPDDYTLLPIPEGDTAEYKKNWARGETNRNKMGASPTKNPRKTLRVAKIKRHEVTGIRPKGANR